MKTSQFKAGDFPGGPQCSQCRGLDPHATTKLKIKVLKNKFGKNKYLLIQVPEKVLR